MGVDSEQVDIDGLRAVYCRPHDATNLPGVIVLHQLVGLTDDIHEICSAFAERGYAAIAPDLFSRGHRLRCIVVATIDLVLRRLPTRVADAQAWLEGRPEVDARRMGVIGFCMGGGFAVTAAIHSRVNVASVNYGVKVPHTAREMEGACPVVASYGEDDRICLTDGRRLEFHLTRLGVEHDVKFYPGAAHGFMNRGRAYSPADAEDAFERVFDFFDGRLNP